MNTRLYHNTYDHPYAHLGAGQKILRWTLMWPIGVAIFCSVTALFCYALWSAGVPFIDGDSISILCAGIANVVFYSSAHLVYRGDSVATYYQAMIPSAARRILNPVVIPFGHVLNFIGIAVAVALGSGAACCCDDD